MKIKLIDAVALHSVVSQLDVSSLSDDKEKIALIRLTIDLKEHLRQWQELVETTNSMAASDKEALLDKESVSEVEISDERLISQESAEKLVISNSRTLTAGALATILYFLIRE